MQSRKLFCPIRISGVSFFVEGIEYSHPLLPGRGPDVAPVIATDVTDPYNEVVGKDIFEASPSSHLSVNIRFHIDKKVESGGEYANARVMERVSISQSLCLFGEQDNMEVHDVHVHICRRADQRGVM